MDLRGKLIRLAYEQPELRSDLLSFLEKQATVGLSPEILIDLVQDRARLQGFDPQEATVTSDLLQAGTRWMSAVARTLSAWQQRHPVLSMGELMKGAPDAIFHLLEGDQKTFDRWVPPEAPRSLSRFLVKSLKRDFDHLVDQADIAAQP